MQFNATFSGPSILWRCLRSAENLAKSYFIGFQPDLEVHSVVAWMNIPLGFKVVVGERIFIDFFEKWPPEENDMVYMLSCSEAQLESRRSLLPDRLMHKEVDWLLQGAGVYVPPPLPQRGMSCGC